MFPLISHALVQHPAGSTHLGRGKLVVVGALFGLVSCATPTSQPVRALQQRGVQDPSATGPTDVTPPSQPEAANPGSAKSSGGAPSQAAPSIASAPQARPQLSQAEIDELLLAAEQGNPDDLLEVIDLQDQERRPWEAAFAPGPLLSAQGPNEPCPYDQTVQDALYSAYAVSPNGEAVGRPNRGHLKDGVPLPDEPDLYTVRSKRASYASSHTALQVVTAFRNFRQQSGYTGRILIGDISAKDGGSYRSHHSHQSGRDLDILMPLMPGTHRWGHNIDWDTTWALVRAFLDTGEVRYIFLDYEIQKHLHAAALRAGEHPDKLSQLISWPKSIWHKTIIRDSPGHWAHVHVRIKCGPTEIKCRSLH